jgi:hypothetical protein
VTHKPFHEVIEHDFRDIKDMLTLAENDEPKKSKLKPLIDDIFKSNITDNEKIIRLCALCDALLQSKNSNHRRLAKDLQGKYLTAEVMEEARQTNPLIYQIQHFLTRSLNVETNNETQQIKLQDQISQLLNSGWSNDEDFKNNFQNIISPIIEELKINTEQFNFSIFPLYKHRLRSFIEEEMKSISISVSPEEERAYNNDSDGEIGTIKYDK